MSKLSAFFNVMTGLFIPDEILKDSRLNFAEKMLLSLYHFYSNGSKNCCLRASEDILKDIDMTRRTYFRSKQHLQELHLITCNGGIKVWYGDKTECQNGTEKCQNGTEKCQNGTQKYNTNINKKCQNGTQKCQNGTQKCQNGTQECQNGTHKEEKKENKKKEEKGITNFDQIVSFLPDTFLGDKLTWFKEEYKEWVDMINNSEYFFDPQGKTFFIKQKITDKFNVYNKRIIPTKKEKKDIVITNKEKKESSYIDYSYNSKEEEEEMSKLLEMI